MKETVLVNYTGRRGGGPIDAYEMAKALIKKGVPVAALISRQTENLEAWKHLGLERLIVIDTYETVFEYVIKTLLFPLNQKKKIKQSLNGLLIRDVYCPMISMWNPLIHPVFKNARKSLVIHDPNLHPGEKLAYWGLKRKYGQYDVLFVHSRKYVRPVSKMYGKPVYYFPLGRHNYYRECADKKTIVTYDPNKINFLFFGRISRYKRLDLLAKAYRVLREKTDINAALTIAGNGDFTPYQKMYSQLPDVTVINRWIADEEVESVFMGENIICVCPYEEATQSGVILVAMDYGAVVIASDSGGLDEQITDGKTGLLFREGSFKDLVRVMYRAAVDQKLRTVLARNAKKAVRECTWDRSASKLIEALHENGRT